ncbi:lipocalin-like protein [Salegentibacter sp. 24]|uniref:lipocalin-like domain-containing protein n=1 Tax=Salegentibacter sp. 24 TaxID=2183986 RepID=UPI00105ED8CC|nr:lipocalin-like domain-containing protein [Salegentibacter sp. 24]TDN93361.1 lipocalin-like protein [Salegentibacter sp. 24]
MKKILLVVLLSLEVLFFACKHSDTPKNNVLGTWKPVKIVVEKNNIKTFPYGPKPAGRLTFTKEMQFLEFIIDSRIPPFESEIRGEGTDEENRNLLNGSLALFGSYTVDEEGNFSGNQVEGSSFPNWVGNVRTTDELNLVVNGDTMTELFYRPSGAKVEIIWKRLKLK